MEKGRLAYIDALKAFGIAFIVLGHFPLSDVLFSDWLYSFHIPLFFFLSGFLFHPSADGLRGQLRRSAYCLLLPILPFMLFRFFYIGLQDYVFYRQEFDLHAHCVDTVKAVLFAESGLGPMWFLVSLFWMRVVAQSLLAKCRLAPVWCLCLAVCLAFCVWHSGFRFNYYQITTAILGLPVFFVGVVAKHYSHIVISFIRQWQYAVLAACLIAYYVCLSFAGGIDLNALQVGFSLPAYYLFAVLGVVFCLALFIRFGPNGFLTTISSGTLLILGTHMFLVQMFKLIYKKLLHISAPNAYMDSVCAVLITLFVIALYYYPIRYLLRSDKWWLRVLVGKK